MTPSIGDITAAIAAGRTLSRREARDLFGRILSGQADPEELAGLLKALAARGETADEIAGAADVMNELVTRVRCDRECIDTCGTGGDGISTFNVSTAAALIAAGAGAVVAKHGNRTNTRASGSAEAIAALGVEIEAPVPVLEACLRDCGIAFLYAPNLHPAMRHAAPVRRRLGIRTIFNLLGPLTNPAGARRQLLGTSGSPLVDKLAAVLAARGAVFAWVVHAADGLCDLSITGPSEVCEVQAGADGPPRVRRFTVVPEDVGLTRGALDELRVDSPQASAQAILDILEGRDRGTRFRHAVLNAGAAIHIAGLAGDLGQGVAAAIRSVESGAALAKLEHLRRASRGG